MFPLDLDDQEPLLGTGAPKEPFGQHISTKRSVGAKNQNVGTGGLCAAMLFENTGENPRSRYRPHRTAYKRQSSTREWFL